jgi:GNAT superfamily N-acetyltransferase
MLARAFHQDPAYLHIFPDGGERSRSLERLFGAVIGYTSKYGQVHTAPLLEGAACWLTPGNSEVTFWRMFRTGLVFQRVVGRISADSRKRLLDALAFMDKIHKELMTAPNPGRGLGSRPVAHWYLWALGVDLDSQGRGIGGKLLQPVLAQADSEGVPCYLETMNEKNLVFYPKWGFAVRREEVVPEQGLRFWAMVREAGS